MFCSKCGTDMADDSQFCRKCGQALGTSQPISAGGGTAAAPAFAAEKPEPSGIRRSFVVGILLLIALIGFLVYQANQSDTATTKANKAAQTQAPSLPPPPQLHTVTVGSGALTVNASQYAYFKLPVPEGAFSVAMKGHFTATGGSGNDIEVYVLGEDAYTNWQNGHSTATYYNSQKVTVGDVNAVLPNGAGTYYLVFNNKFSLLTPKAVSEQIALTYYTR